MKKEMRVFTFDVHSEENDEHGHFLTGRPIVFGQRTNIGKFDEIIEPGALDKTDLKDVRFLVNHNTDMIPLARSRNNNENSTMQLIPDEYGMLMRADLDIENNAEARSLYSAVKRGDITGMSFMFTVDKDKWDNPRADDRTRHILSLDRVFEVSAVTFPAYVQTSIQARGLSEELDSLPDSLESAIAEEDAIERKKKQILLMIEVHEHDD